jgi:hypothetical protein
LPQKMPLDPQQTLPLVLALGPDDLEGMDEVVMLRAGDVAKPVRVQAMSIPAMLGFSSNSLDFGKLTAGETKTLSLVVSNTGGSTASITADASSPFRLEAAALEVAPKEKQQFDVKLDGNSPGVVSSKLVIHTSDGNREFPLTAEIVAPERKYVSASGTSSAPAPDPTIEFAEIEKGTSAVPPITDLKAGRLKPTRAEISWRVPKKGGYTYEIQVRRLSMDADGKIQVQWIPVPNAEFSEAAGRMFAHIPDIPTGITFTARVVAKNSAGKLAQFSPNLQISLPQKMVIFTVQRVLLVIFAAILLGALYVKRRMRY